MNDDLDDLLREARVPEPPEEWWRRLPAKVVLRAFAAGEAPRARSPRSPWFRLGFTLAPAALGLALGFLLWHRADRSDPYRQLENGKEWRAVAAQYGARVRAIVRDEQGLHVVLADRADVPAATPIWVELQSGAERRAMVTMSGQEVTVGGRKLQVLADPAGKLILIGPDFFWSEEAQAGAAEHLQVRSHALAHPF